jgi:hypothetical protein
MRTGALLVAGVVVLVTEVTWAQTPPCDALQGPARVVAQSLLDSQHPYDCCDGTLRACLKERPPCRLAGRLANEVCSRAGAGQDRVTIESALRRRASSMMHLGKPVSIDLRGVSPAGDVNAPVAVVMYLCGRCPYCARLTPVLHQAVTSGSLKGRVRLYVKVFPIRSHPHSTESGLAMVAASRLGGSWPFLLALYADTDRFDVNKLPDIARRAGLPGPAFSALLQDGSVRNTLIEHKKEGLRHKVDATPTVFINGFRYDADLGAAYLLDALEETHDRVTGRERG